MLKGREGGRDRERERERERESIYIADYSSVAHTAQAQSLQSAVQQVA